MPCNCTPAFPTAGFATQLMRTGKSTRQSSGDLPAERADVTKLSQSFRLDTGEVCGYARPR
eukprot:1630220-Alexandrium_andersonii.AAC.1